MLLQIENLTFGWLDTPLLNLVNCSVDRGYIVQLTGENGSGKTTLLKLIAGMIPHFERGNILRGDILFNDKSVLEYPPKSFFPWIGFVPGKNIDFFLFTENMTDEISFVSSVLKFDRKTIDARQRDFFNFFQGLEHDVKLPFKEMDFSQKVLSLTFIYFLQDAVLYLFDEVLNRFSVDELNQWHDFFEFLAMKKKAIIHIDHQIAIRGNQQWSLSQGNLVTHHA